MVVQRLTIRAARDKLRVIHVWRCLAQSDAKVVRWTVYADHGTGTETMTVDFVEADPQRITGLAAELAQPPFEMSVTASNLTTVPACPPHPSHPPHQAASSARAENSRLEPLL